MNLLLYILNEMQSSAALIPIIGLFIVRSFLIATEAAVPCADADRKCPLWVAKLDAGCDDWLKANCPYSCSICRPGPEISSSVPLFTSVVGNKHRRS